ncbi:unnamed protein product [Urochloa decumbens]|uniref:F-box domain-containing protein n=1 Tax=Urochloa decumbens TaxID=240449 RepID=A0ABC9BVF3_9POAL
MEAPTAEDLPASATEWSELPLDALSSVFIKLGAIEILMNAGLVCRSWLQAAKLPDLWRSVDMTHHKLLDIDYGDEFSVDLQMAELGFSYLKPNKINGEALRAMAKVAIDRSGGQLEVFVGKWFVTDELLKFIADRSPALKDVGLISCFTVSNKGFTELSYKCPRLEELQLTFCNNVSGHEVFEATGKACPQLKHFRLARRGYELTGGEAAACMAMHELRSLTIHNSNITRRELEYILDGSPHLEFLDLTGCFNIVVDDALRARCAGIKSLTLPCTEDDDYYGAGLYASDCSYDFLGDSD